MSILTFMARYFTAREFGWIESSDSEVSAELFANEIESDYRSSDDEDVSFARHEPTKEVDLDDALAQRDFWSRCAIGFILDYKKFFVDHLHT